jgi:uncharacterized protein (DUF305 family)
MYGASTGSVLVVVSTLQQSDEINPPRRFGRDLALGALVGLVLFGAIFGASKLTKRGSTARPLTAIEVGFLHDMIDHHAQAIVISKAYLANNTGGAKSYADEVILFQDQEVGIMRALLAEAKQPVERVGSEAMAWMGHGMTVADMPGMQTPAKLTELSAARGAAADGLWFSMMSDHHVGGIEMLDAVGGLSRVKRITEMAAKMRHNQGSEIIEYQQAAKRFGLPIPTAQVPAMPVAGTATTMAHSH